MTTNERPLHPETADAALRPAQDFALRPAVPELAEGQDPALRPVEIPAAAHRGLRALSWAGSMPILLLLVMALVAIAPLLQPGYFWGAHDARHDVYFMFQYDKSVQEGTWFPRWSPDWAYGYGYPFFIVYGPLATLLGEAFHHFLGLDFEACVKAVLALSLILSGLGMYGFVRSWLGRNAALVAGVAYMVIPYHLVDVYVRAAMAESFALALLPFILWGFRETVLRPSPRALVGAAVAYAALMWTSNLVAILFTPALALYVLVLVIWRTRDERRAANVWQVVLGRLIHHSLMPIVAVGLGLGLSAAFFVPAIVEQNYINRTQWFGEYYDPFRHFVSFHQLFNPAWGFGISQPGPNDVAQGSLSFQLGAVPALLSLCALLTAGRLAAARRREVYVWGLWAAASIFLTLGISAPAWRLPLVPYAQFPWRYLMLAIIPLSILPAALVAGKTDKENARLGYATVLLAALLLLGSYPYLQVEMREPTPDQGPVSYAALMRFQRTSDEMTGVTAWVDPEQRPRWSAMAEEWVHGRDVTTKVDYGQVPQNDTLAVNSEELGSAHEQVWYHAGKPGQAITFNRFWYPGWKAYLLDGKDGRRVRELAVEREDGPLARVTVPVEPGEGYLLLRFEDTPLRAAAKWTTYGTLALIALGLLVLALRRGRRNKALVDIKH